MKKLACWLMVLVLLSVGLPVSMLAEEETPTTAMETEQTVPTAAAPTGEATAIPTEEATVVPTEATTAAPTEETPTEAPTAVPTEETPTEAPTAAPTEETPTEAPTAAPTEEPTEAPTDEPTGEPEATPSAEPSAKPSESVQPSGTPAASPSMKPNGITSEDAVIISRMLVAPTNVSAQVASYKSVRLSWGGVSDATRYVVQRSDAYAGPYTEIASPTNTAYTDAANITCGQTYFYRIKALDNSGNQSSFSSIVAVTVIPVVPTLQSAVPVSATAIKLIWSRGDGASGYYVYRSLSGAGNFERIATISNGSTLSYADTGLVTGSAYSYRIQSYRLNSANVPVVSDYSNIITAVPVPTAPKNLRISGFTYNSLTMTWSAVTGATAYIVMRSDSPNGVFLNVAEQSGTTYTDNSLQSGLTYYYKVAAIVNGVQSPFSEEVSAFARPVAPTGLTAVSKSDTTIKLTWNTSMTSGYSGYIIEMAEGGSSAFTEVKSVAGVDIATTDVSGLTTGQPYLFRIRGYTTVSGGRVVGAASAQVGSIPKPRIPTGFTVSVNGYTSIALEWNAVNMASGYEVYRGTSANTATFQKIQTVADNGGGSYRFVDMGLTCGTRYYYRVISYTVNSSGTRVYSSYTSVLSTAPIPSAPGNASVRTSTNSTATLGWTAVPGASGYDIIMATAAAGPYSLKASVNGGGATGAVVSGLSTGVTVYLKIRAYRMVGTSKVLGQLSKTLTLTPLPGAVSLTGKSLLLTTVQLQWPSVSGATGYLIYSSTSEYGTYSQVMNVTGATTCKLTVTPGRPMFFKARAYCTVGSVQRYGAYSNTVSVTALPATTSITSVAPLSEDRMKVQWRQTADIKNKEGGFYLYRGETKNVNAMVKIAELSRTDILEYVDSGLELGKVYFYAVRSFVMTDYGIVFGNYSAIASGYTRPGVPTGLTIAQNNASSLTLEWTGVSGAINGYEIYYATAANGPYKKLGESRSTAASVSYTTPAILTYNQDYYFKVRALMNAGGVTIYGDYGNTVAGKTYLAAPASAAANSVGGGQVKVLWSQVPEAYGYHIYVSTNPTSNYRLALTTDAGKKAGVVSGLRVGEQYYFKVAAYRTVSGKQIDGEWSAVASAMNKPSSPANLKATVMGYRSIKLTWNGVGGASYRIYRAPAGTDAYVRIEDKVTSTSFTLDGQETGVMYQYYVTAYATSSTGGIVESPASNSVTAKAALLAPAKISADYMASSDQFKITWGKVANASGYMVQRSSSPTSGFTTIASLESADSVVYFDDASGIARGSKAYYRVLGYYRNPETLAMRGGYASKVASDVRPLAVPTGLSAAALSATSVRLSWTMVSDANGYYILRSDAAGGPYKIIGKVGRAGGFTHNGVTPGKSNYYKIFAYRMVNGEVVKSNYSGYTSITLRGLTTPQNVTAAPLSSTSVRLSWMMSPEAHGYYILRSDTANGAYKIVGKVGRAGGFTHNGLTTGKTYYYKIFAYQMVNGQVIKSDMSSFATIRC